MNKVALITGGASGIGKALAAQLLERGHKVVIADRHEDSLTQTENELRDAGGKVVATTLDVRDAEAFDALVERIMNREGRLDYLFNNAGIATGGLAREMTLEDWNALVDVNLRGVINGVHSAYGRMVKQGFGHIVNTASAAGLIPAALASGYCATKHAVVGLSQALRIEGKIEGVNVSVVCPGAVDTDALKQGGRYGRYVGDASLMESAAESLRAHTVDPDSFSRKVLKQVDKNKGIIVVPGAWRLFWLISRVFPEGVLRMMVVATRANFKKVQEP